MMDQGHSRKLDRIYHLQRYIYDLTRKYYLFGRDTVIDQLKLKSGQAVLEVGTGTARNLIKLARKNPQVTFFGVDASEEMLKTAREHIRNHNLQDRIHVAFGFAEDLTSEYFHEISGLTSPRKFDAIIFSYSLSMIDNWKDAIAACIDLLAEDGSIWIVDFSTQKRLPKVISKVLLGWLKLYHVTPREELRAYGETLAGKHNLGFEYRSIGPDYAQILKLQHSRQ